MHYVYRILWRHAIALLLLFIVRTAPAQFKGLVSGENVRFLPETHAPNVYLTRADDYTLDL